MESGASELSQQRHDNQNCRNHHVEQCNLRIAAQQLCRSWLGVAPSQTNVKPVRSRDEPFLSVSWMAGHPRWQSPPTTQALRPGKHLASSSLSTPRGSRASGRNQATLKKNSGT